MLKLGLKSTMGSAWDEVGNNEIVQILISHQKDIIFSIQFVYAEKGRVRHSQIHGQPGGLNFNMVTFDYPSEFLTSVSGSYVRIKRSDKVECVGRLVSITFGTNKSTYGPFGTGASSTLDFKYEFGPRSCFMGFHGTIYNSSCVHAIGIYIKPIESLECKKQAVESNSNEKRVAASYYI